MIATIICVAIAVPIAIAFEFPKTGRSIVGVALAGAVIVWIWYEFVKISRLVRAEIAIERKSREIALNSKSPSFAERDT